VHPERPDPVGSENQRVIAEGFAQMTKVMEASNRAVAHGLMTIARQNAAAPPGEAGATSAEIADLIRKLDANMTTSLMQVARSMEDSFVAYSQNLKTPVAPMPDHSEPPAAADVPPPRPRIPAPVSDDTVVYMQKFFDAARNAYREAGPFGARSGSKG
jgi:hypothetical protein